MAHPHSEVKSRQQQHPAVELFFSCCPMTRITKDKENEDGSSLCQTGLARSSPNNSSQSHQGVVMFSGRLRYHRFYNLKPWVLNTNPLIDFVDYGIVTETWT